ncbi:hypothetical protein GCM10025789_30620 [Tessaracoccus lubricantis]|uniref:Uncharacterized protein n=1 Tax=Tessaracoccus lubricantis TaxID=545543 RepID=A0ABP9FMF4_9ACTN
MTSVSENHAARLLVVLQTLRKRAHATAREATLEEVWFWALTSPKSSIRSIDWKGSTSWALWRLGHYGTGVDPRFEPHTDRPAVAAHVAAYSELFPAALEQATLLEKAGFRFRWTQDAHDWGQAFFPTHHGFASTTIGSEEIITSQALKHLKSVAEAWRQHEALISVVPQVSDRELLRDEIYRVIGSVLDDQTLHADLQQLIVRRLHDILWAIDHWIAGGSDGVRAACERLAFAYTIADEKTQRQWPTYVWSFIRKVMLVAAVVSDVGGSYQTITLAKHLILDDK